MDVRLEGFQPLIGAYFINGLVSALEGSIVDQYVQATKLPNSLLNQTFAMILAFDVAGQKQGSLTSLANPFGSLFRILIFAEV